MKYIILSIPSITFLLLNALIIINDIKEKKIPNKYLLFLLLLIPFFYSYLFFTTPIDFASFFLQIGIALIVSFVLYYIGIWSAGDAKYLLTLSLFIPHIWIVPLVGNIGLITIVYLILYFIWFYLGKCLFNWKYSKALYKNIYNDLHDKLLNFLKYNGEIKLQSSARILLSWGITFAVFFVGFRLLRLFVTWSSYYREIFGHIWTYFVSYHIYLMVLTTLFFIYARFLLRKWFDLIMKVLWIKHEKGWMLIPWILFTILVGFIISEYLVNPYRIWIYLYKIFTVYLILFAGARILFYSYKTTFHISETYVIDINDVKPWDIFDKDYVVKMFGTQQCLWFNNEKWVLSPNPKKFIMEIDNPLDKEWCKLLKDIYEITNEHHKEKSTRNFWEIDKIKVLKTFAFSWYIFFWFILTLFFQEKTFIFIVESIIRIIKTFVS